MVKPGDIVARKKYGKDIFFKVKSLIITDAGETTVILRGLDVRLIADAPLEDLELQPAEKVLRYRHSDIQRHSLCFRRILQRREAEREVLFNQEIKKISPGGEKEKEKEELPGEVFFEVPGRVLHLDGDEEYLDKCLHAYTQLKIPAQGFYVPEEQQAAKVKELLLEYTPDILVLTGHDGLIGDKSNYGDLDSYRHSKHFVQAVRAARALRPGHDDLVIFAGACQSHYEALLKAGATFASAPARVLIHAYDPVFVVERVAYTSISRTLGPSDIIKDTVTGLEGVGGVEIKGKLRLGYPAATY